MKNYPSIGVQVPQILLPNPGIDPQKWAVIACDQFTSQPEYWQQVEDFIGDAPSTLRIILPEVYLGKPEESKLAQYIQQTMKEYLDEDLLEPHDGFILVERSVSGKTRRGLMLALDLECYNYNKGSQSLIRATEGTILERLPPRMKIRQGAVLESPHILVLINDPEHTVIEPLLEHRANLKTLYDFELMFGSGHLKGYLLEDPSLEQQVIHALEKLSNPQYFKELYGVAEGTGVLLFAMGDGNHSLATAKSLWEKIKPQVGIDHPARYALVEIENLHDEGLQFEPIHRILFEVKEDFQVAMQRHFGEHFRFIPCQNKQEMTEFVFHQPGVEHAIGLISGQDFGVVFINQPTSNLPVGTLQTFLDEWLRLGGAGGIDYVHGENVIFRLSAQPDSLGFFLPAMEKDDLFKTVILDGALPRKTFSMGEAKEKRFYMECKRIE